MRAQFHLILLLLLPGCATSRNIAPYTYVPPVTIKVGSLPASRDDSFYFGYFTLSNVCEDPMWFLGDGKDVDHYIEWKSLAWYGPRSGFDCSCTGWHGAEQRKLGPGESVTFRAFLGNYPREPFRVGVRLSPELDNRSQCDRVYWSDWVSP